MDTCHVKLEDGILALENDRIRRLYKWNNGHLIGLRIEDLMRGHGWDLDAAAPDMFPGRTVDAAGEGGLELMEHPATSCTPAHLRAEVVTSLDGLEIKRVFRLYPGCPAIACDLYFRGHAEDLSSALVLERLSLPRVHWRALAVRFFDVTDRNNTLVHERAILPYRFPMRLVGNLLFLDEVLQDRGLFVLKEAPCADAQLRYPGHDFVVQIGEVELVGGGLGIDDLDLETWTRAYGFVTGVTGNGDLGRLQALRTYQEQLRIHQPDRDEMVMMNIWGDRGQDTRISESFALAELAAGARLGVTHLQLDDGWQWGRSSNSAFEGGSLERIWDNPDYWTPHPERFPDGLAPVVARGRELGIETCLWFNPSKDGSYAHWRDDAETLIGLYRDYGIRTFKIDGVQVPDKRAEVNLRRLFDAVRAATDDEVVFNLDVTAGQRYGYHYFNEYGNVFLENRYTDWANYYPHWTLRNLWMLSHYVPPQNLQIEFLNVWRNADHYRADDPLAPTRVPFAYAFAITMVAQPLAWFEATGLPESAYEISSLLRSYRQHQVRLHEGQIFPMGEEPSGTGWTGFQSIREDGGYVLVLREYNDRHEARLKLHALGDRAVTFQCLLGDGSDFEVAAGPSGDVFVDFVDFSLPHPYSFALYAYAWRDPDLWMGGPVGG
ncbi:MAG: alpha-galactosidase [Anaerolineae bacterium]